MMSRRINSLLAFLAFFVVSCSDTGGETADSGNFSVCFGVKGIGVETRSDSFSALNAGTTLRVLAFRRVGVSADLSVDEYMGEGTYVVPVGETSGKLTAVSALQLCAGTYDFYALTPDLTVTRGTDTGGNTYKVEVGNGTDYATSLTEAVTVSLASPTVSLNSLVRRCSKLTFVVSPKEDNITAVNIISASVTNMTNTPLSTELNTDFEVSDVAKTTETSVTGFTVPDSTKPLEQEASIVVLPRVAGTFNFKMLVEFDGSGKAVDFSTPLPADLVLLPGKNYIFTLKMKGRQASLSFDVVDWTDTDDFQTNMGDWSLSFNGTANCYIVSESNKDYSFDGTVRGNGCTTDYAKTQYSDLTDGAMFPTALSGASDAVTIPKADIADAVIVWQTDTRLLSNVSWNSSSGEVKFTTGSVVNGNAVIAVRDASHNILWSWHIWRTNGISLNDMAANAITVQTNTEGYTWYTAGGTNHERKLMDRNLGALSTDGAGNIGAGCLQYQFGRKDPFVGPANYSNSNTEQSVYDGAGNSFVFSSQKSTSAGTNAKTSIDYSIKNPEKFIYENVRSFNWIVTATISSADWKVSNCLWGDNNTSADKIDPAPWDGGKTIYDPCPLGWRVAPADTWTGILKSTATDWNDQEVSSSVYCTGTSWTINYAAPYGHTFYFNDDTGTAIFCPASGFRNPGGGSVYNAGLSGSEWLSSPRGGTLYGSSLDFDTDEVQVEGYECRSGGFSVRCVQE